MGLPITVQVGTSQAALALHIKVDSVVLYPGSHDTVASAP